MARGVGRREWKVSDVIGRPGVVRDAVTIFLNSQFVGQWVEAKAQTEDQLRAAIATLVRAFAALTGLWRSGCCEIARLGSVLTLSIQKPNW